ncbi:MAG: hypothetical protein LC754_04140 [Acidobacteria bacterium]|nr:hypothetical protein [Acidobacteriota bacterium]
MGEHLIENGAKSIGEFPPVDFNPDISSLRNWLPVDVVINDARPYLRWMEMSGVGFSEPFFHQTVERVKRDEPWRPEVLTEFDALIQLEKLSESLSPTGFIFHTSRCGSTLISNACRAAQGALVISEAHPVEKLVGRIQTNSSEGGIKFLLYSIFLRGAVSALGQRRLGNERHYFVKFSSCSVLQYLRVREIWPNAPCVFVYRNPVETMVSNLLLVPEWMNVRLNPEMASAILGENVESVLKMTPEEFCARALGKFYNVGVEHTDAKTLLVNFDQLSPATLIRILEFFGVHLSEAEIEVLARTSRLYSKDPIPERPFADDTKLKKETASPLVREMAERWAAEPYQRLRMKQADLQRS